VPLTIEIDREICRRPDGSETAGRWIAEVPDLPGCMVYAADQAEAVRKVKALALRIIAERREHREPAPEPILSQPKAA
jgi:predicted RNase H-like HicB family nuclease